MHPDLKAAIVAEVTGDPTGRGYAGKSAAEIAALMNAPVVVTPPAAYRNVLISDVLGYLEARLVLVRLEDWIADPDTPKGAARDAARTLLRVTSGDGLAEFRTADEQGRANIFGLFSLLIQAGAGGLTLQHYSEIVAMAQVPGVAINASPRWSVVREGVPDAPGAADEALVSEALA